MLKSLMRLLRSSPLWKKMQGKYEKELIFHDLSSYLSKHFTLKKNHTLLEVGVGSDGFASFYKSAVGKYIGLDVEDYSNFYRDVKITVYDGYIMPIEENTVDVVVSHSVLEHVTDVKTTMSEINRVLKPGGIAYITINPLYYSAWGSHLYKEPGEKFDNWQHLDPAQSFYMTDNPLPGAPTTGHHLNKLTVLEFLSIVSQLPWSIVRFDRKVDTKPLPDFLTNSQIPLLDLVTFEFRFIATKVY